MDGVRLQLPRLAAAELVTGRPARRVVLVATFAVLTTLGAYAVVPLPGTPVPVTLQVMVVILSGALLGPTLGAAVILGGGAAPLALLIGDLGRAVQPGVPFLLGDARETLGALLLASRPRARTLGPV